MRGASSPYEDIMLNDTVFRVSSTVYRALESIQNAEDPRSIWIDAICIDQGEEAIYMREREDQLFKMTAICKCADEVIVWLDIDHGDRESSYRDDDLCSLFDKLKQCSTVESTNHTLHGLSTAERSVLNLRWWQRTWILQETAVNEIVVFRCRSETMSWNEMASFLLNAPRLGSRVGFKRRDFFKCFQPTEHINLKTTGVIGRYPLGLHVGIMI